MILIDSNIFIQSARMEYRFCFCGGFWHLLKELHNAGQVCSIRAVQQELLAGHDDLAKWIKQLPNSFFLDERQDRNVQARYGDLMNWAVNHPQFNDVAKKQFAQPHADPWLVAYAAVHKMKILTHEKFDPNIPAAASKFPMLPII